LPGAAEQGGNGRAGVSLRGVQLGLRQEQAVGQPRATKISTAQVGAAQLGAGTVATAVRDVSAHRFADSPGG